MREIFVQYFHVLVTIVAFRGRALVTDPGSNPAALSAGEPKTFMHRHSQLSMQNEQILISLEPKCMFTMLIPGTA